ncbi:uncharacterized protein HD556DRAFT_1307210 [Suillus plorans]|uniref:Uncharacterized protein n=1 Tax=Suillus plorans TaxID=116603 RepID=A0A9P7ASY3_9AGAM|nr:uncharacterized protein HD556DRAFT_1307210 [Suillus plorans]KAG1795988.1 hypothetical protein HD556DRAFT_1307210 [Suillus plorans]
MILVEALLCHDFKFAADIKLEVITRIVISVDKLVWGLNTTNVNDPKYRPAEPPLRPAMLCDRDDLVVVTNIVANDKHIGLIGPASMGKSSLMNAILNELSQHAGWSPSMLLKKWDNQYSKVLDQYYGSACIELMAYNICGLEEIAFARSG